MSHSIKALSSGELDSKEQSAMFLAMIRAADAAADREIRKTGDREAAYAKAEKKRADIRRANELGLTERAKRYQREIAEIDASKETKRSESFHHAHHLHGVVNNPSPKWRALVVRGELSAAIKSEAEHASGAYAVREKKSHRVVYVGESHRGRMWKTLLRHFQAPESFRKVRERGVFTRSPENYEVAIWVTSKGTRSRASSAAADQKAMAAQAEWIAHLQPSLNVDDGEAWELPAEDDDPWGGLIERPAHGNPAMTLLGKLTHLSWKTKRGVNQRGPLALKSAPSLVYDAKGKLLIVYAAKAIRPATSAEEKEYARTHWGQRGDGRASMGVIATAPMHELGAGVEITYTTQKGTRELVDWRHEWGEGARGKWTAPIVCEHACKMSGCAEQGYLSLRGGTYVVNERGIVG